MEENETEKCIKESCEVLNDARQNHWQSLSEEVQHIRRYPKIALSMGPLNAVLEDGDEYRGTYSADITQQDLISFHFCRAQKLSSICTADVLCFETIGNVQEAVAIAHAMSQSALQSHPYWISFQCRNDKELAAGQKLEYAVSTVLLECKFSNIVAIGINCYQTAWTHQLVASVSRTIDDFMLCQRQNNLCSWTVHTIAYPNSGELCSQGKWDWPSETPMTPSEWASTMCSSGAHIVGGCCRVGPNHILALREKVLLASGSSTVQNLSP